jgi:hypothetical protein
MKSSLTTTEFITKDTKIDRHERDLNGAMAILYAFIARADKSVNLLFWVTTIWMMFYLLRWHTGESLAGIVTALCGSLLYLCAGKHVDRSA